MTLSDAPGDDPIRVNPDQRPGSVQCLGAASHLDPARAPGVHAGQVVDDDRGAPGALDVAVLLGALEVAAADLDRVGLRVVAPADRDHVRRSVLADRCEAPEAPVAVQIFELRVAELAHDSPKRSTAVS